MLMVASHYHFLANRYPGTGGLYNYVKYIFGYDRAFLVAWFMFLVYIAIFWANATSVPLFSRYFLQGFFKFGYLYTIFGYDVYLGEALVTLLVIGLIALLCMKSKKATARSMVVLVLVFTVGITLCFAAAMLGHGSTGMSMEPAFVPDKGEFQQVVRIAFLSPWPSSASRACPIPLRNTGSSTPTCSAFSCSPLSSPRPSTSSSSC